MSLKLVKRHSYCLVLTVIGLVLLFVVGLLSSFWAEQQQGIQASHPIGDGILLLWRIAAYVLLVMLWPRLISRALAKRRVKREILASRKPLLILIFLYEFLIVLNPLAIVIGWVV